MSFPKNYDYFMLTITTTCTNCLPEVVHTKEQIDSLFFLT